MLGVARLPDTNTGINGGMAGAKAHSVTGFPEKIRLIQYVHKYDAILVPPRILHHELLQSQSGTIATCFALP